MSKLKKKIRKFLMWLLIPSNTEYCYDDELCPFYSKICGLEGSAHCSYVEDEIDDFDRNVLLDDQCKICGEKLWNGKE